MRLELADTECEFGSNVKRLTMATPPAAAGSTLSTKRGKEVEEQSGGKSVRNNNTTKIIIESSDQDETKHGCCWLVFIVDLTEATMEGNSFHRSQKSVHHSTLSGNPLPPPLSPLPSLLPQIESINPRCELSLLLLPLASRRSVIRVRRVTNQFGPGPGIGAELSEFNPPFFISSFLHFFISLFLSFSLSLFPFRTI